MDHGLEESLETRLDRLGEKEDLPRKQSRNDIAYPSIRFPVTVVRQVKVKNQTFITQECCSAIAYTVHQSRALTTSMTASVSW